MDRILECYRGEVGSERVVAEARERIDWLISQVEEGPVLDIGCSQGVVGLLLAREGVQSLGIDNDPEAIAYARKRLGEDGDNIAALASFVEHDAEELDQLDISGYRTIVASLILDQLDSAQEFLKTLSTVAARDSRVLIQVSLGSRGSAPPWYPHSLLELLEPALVVTSVERVGERIAVVARPRRETDADRYPVDAGFCDFVEACFAYKEQLLSGELQRLRRYVQNLKTDRKGTVEGDDEIGDEKVDWRKLAVERRWSLVNAKKQNETLRRELSLTREKMEAKQEMIVNLQEKLTEFRRGGSRSDE